MTLLFYLFKKLKYFTTHEKNFKTRNFTSAMYNIDVGEHDVKGTNSFIRIPVIMQNK